MSEEEEKLRLKVEEMQYESGLNDARAGHGPAMASKKYVEGYMAGRRDLSRQRQRDGLCPTCGK